MISRHEWFVPISLEVTRRVAPDCLNEVAALLPLMTEEALRTSNADTDQPLAFGAELLAGISPAIIRCVDAALRAMATGATDSLKESTKDSFKERLKTSIFGGKPKAKKVEGVLLIHEVAIQKALALKLSPKTAQMIADGIVAEIAIRQAQEAK
jgi:hypothetical protein